MRWSKMLSMVQVHAEGEQTNVITGGVLDLPGKTMQDKMNYINQVDDSLRRFTVFEPRGRAQMSSVLLLPPTHPDADAAFLIMQADRAHAMSGSNTIGVTTVLLETGLVEMREPETVVTLETPAGLVRVKAQCHNGKCERVTLDGVPSFVERLDVPVSVPGYGDIKVDIAYGGCYYALIDVRQLGLQITHTQARALVNAGSAVHQAFRSQVQVEHPEYPGINFISYVMLTDRDDENPAVLRGCTVLPPGRADRSPCGTGNSARLAVMHARGEAKVGNTFSARSVIDSEFRVELVGETEVAGRPAVLPRISGRGWIYGMGQIGVDPSDPYPLGFVLTDTWGEDLEETQ